jgi:predicted metal-binding protein
MVGKPIHGRPRDCKQRAGAKRHWIMPIREGGAGLKRCEPGDLPCANVSNGRRRGGQGVDDDSPFVALFPRLFAAGGDCMARFPMNVSVAEPGVTIFVCITCRHENDEGVRPGKTLFDAMQARLLSRDDANIALRAVECLSVCKRPCTLALAGPGKWTYVVGDLDKHASVEDILDAALKFAETEDGIIPWRERPQSFRKGVISRVPPLPKSLEEV